jgi:hypothetical protein
MEKQLKEQSQEVKREHDTQFPKGEELYTFMWMYMMIRWKPLQVHNITTFTITFATITTIDTRRSIGY